MFGALNLYQIHTWRDKIWPGSGIIIWSLKVAILWHLFIIRPIAEFIQVSNRESTVRCHCVLCSSWATRSWLIKAGHCTGGVLWWRKTSLPPALFYPISVFFCWESYDQKVGGNLESRVQLTLYRHMFFDQNSPSLHAIQCMIEVVLTLCILVKEALSVLMLCVSVFILVPIFTWYETGKLPVFRVLSVS